MLGALRRVCDRTASGPNVEEAMFSGREAPSGRWLLLGEVLMGSAPGAYLTELRAAGALAAMLPEVSALFGVPSLSDAAEPVDVGVHLARVLDLMAAHGLPLDVRFAALAQPLGKGGTPREIWPSHYKHEARGAEQLLRLCARFDVPAPCRALAALCIAECDRVHRASDLRAGALAALLARVEALEEPERFDKLLTVCTFDYAAYEGHAPDTYPKAPRLRRALAAYGAVSAAGQSGAELESLRAEAVARALMPARYG
jgi:tRNA nucleotidyltransferase (CCA-adding enzyme)